MTTGGTRRLLTVNRAAYLGGLRPGGTVADAQALIPDLQLARADPEADLALLEYLADSCLCYTPWSAVDDWTEGKQGGGLWLDITGCAHLQDGEDSLLRDLVSRCGRHGLVARAAVADTPGAAWAWTRFGDSGSPCLPVGADRRILAALPLAALRLLPSTVEGLNRLGLKSIGDLEALPRAGLAARFGPAVAVRLDQMRGRQDEPISPQRPPERHQTHLRFAEPIARSEDIAAAVHQMLASLCQELGRQRLGVRRLQLVAFRLDATRQRLGIGTSQPNRDPRHLFRLLVESLAALDAGFGIDMLRLSATNVAPLQTEQAAFAAVSQGGEGEQNGQSLGHLCDSLGNRLGFDRIYRFALRQSHLPERLVRRLPPFPASSAPGGESAPEGRRPLRLFIRPEAVEAVAPLPDAPPLLFRWRRRIHRVAHAEGPERLSAEWWREGGLDRDYYCVEDVAGCRFWLYREGAYGGETIPRWFLHGIFP